MSYNAKKLLKQGILSLPVVALLSGCGGSDGSASTTAAAVDAGSEPSVRITGDAVKGVIRQGVVTANRLVVDKAGRYQTDKLVAKPVRTDDQGKYELRLRGKANGWALVTLTADDRTRMTCDVAPHCVIANGEIVPFGGTFALDSGFTLSGAGDLSTGIVYLTPLTQLAVGVAERGEEGLSAEALKAAYRDVEDWFGLRSGSLLLPPLDLTRLDETPDITADAIQLALANAAFLALVNESPKWDSITDVLTDLSVQVSLTGGLEAMGSGVDLSVAGIVEASAVQAMELRKTVQSSIVDQKLAVVTQRNLKQFEKIAEAQVRNPERDDPFADSDTGEDSWADAGSGNDTKQPGRDMAAADPGTPVGGESGGNVVEQSTPDADNFVAANVARLSWRAPLMRENGDSMRMGELSGYEIAYGLSEEALDNVLSIADAYAWETDIEDLTNGSWYFSIRSIDTDGNKSRWSEVVSKVVSI